MAISFPITGVTNTFSASRSPAFTLGTSPVENDILVAFISSTTAAAVADISGWTNVLGSTVDVESDTHQSFMVYHRVTAAEDTANTVTWTLTNIYNATETGRISVAVLRGVALTGELVGTASGSTTALQDGTIPSVTPTADSTVIAGFSQDGTGTRTSAPTGYTDIAGGTATQHNYVYRRTTDASNGVPTGTAAANTTTNDEYVSIVAAFVQYVAPAEVFGTAAGTFPGWSGTSIATVDHPATIVATWGGWSGTSSATVSAGATDHAASTSTTWDGWSGTSSATVDHPATISDAWGGWSSTSSATVEHPATIAATFDGWSGTSTATIDNPASFTTTWAGWSGAASATVEHFASISTTWPGWVGMAVVPDVDVSAGTTPSGGSRNQPWLSFKDQPPQRTRRQIDDDDEVLLLLAL